jgi:hypothetical protein
VRSLEGLYLGAVDEAEAPAVQHLDVLEAGVPDLLQVLLLVEGS